MNVREIYPLIKLNLDLLKVKSESVGNSEYKLSGLNSLRVALKSLKPLSHLVPDIAVLLDSWIFKETDADTTTSKIGISAALETKVSHIRASLETLSRLIETSEYAHNEDVLYIKLPETKSFEDLSKAANELKKGIELPIYDENINGNINIISAEAGSIWLVITVGTVAAVNIIGAICWAAAVIRKKHAEAKMFEEHAKTLTLKNDALSVFGDAQKVLLNNILTSEAEAIATKHYNHNAPETTERLKLAINSVADLIERGAQILPASDNVEALKSFPNYNQLELITSSIKQLKDN